MTEQEKFAEAVRLLQESSYLFDKAELIFNNLGIEMIIDQRPIRLDFGIQQWKRVFLYTGVKEAAEINGTEIFEGRPYKGDADKDKDYIMTTINGVVFYQLKRCL